MVVPARSDRNRAEDFDYSEDDASPFDDDSHEQEYDEPDAEDSDEDESDDDDSSDGIEREVEESSSLSPEQLQQEIERYKARLNGANRKIQELSHGRTQLETQWQQERAQYLEALMRERIQDLPPDEQEERMQMFHTALQAQQENAQHQQERQLYGEVARRATIIDLTNKAKENGISVTEEDLEPFDSANEMIAHIRKIRDLQQGNQQTKKRQRKRRKKNDNFEQPQQTSAPPKEPQTIEDAEAEFRRLYRSQRRRR